MGSGRTGLGRQEFVHAVERDQILQSPRHPEQTKCLSLGQQTAPQLQQDGHCGRVADAERLRIDRHRLTRLLSQGLPEMQQCLGCTLHRELVGEGG